MITAHGQGITETFKQQVGQCLLQACLSNGQSQQEAEKAVVACDWQDLNANQVRAFLKVLAVAWSAVKAQTGL
jgi:hypothetical protein